MRSPFLLRKGRARVLHVGYQRMAELTATDVSSATNLSLQAAADLTVRSNAGRISFIPSLAVSGDMVTVGLTKLSSSSKTIDMNYSNPSDVSTNGSGVLVEASTGRSFVYVDGSWTFREGDLRFRRIVSDNTYASHKFSITAAGNLVLAAQKGAASEKAVAYYYFGLVSPVRTIVCQPSELGSTAQATQVVRYATGPVEYSVSFNYEIVDFDTSLLDGVNVSAYGSVATQDSRTFRFLVHPGTGGAFYPSVPGDAFHDAQGNAAPSRPGFAVLYDPEPPRVDANGPIANGPSLSFEGHVVPWQIRFSKPVANFDTSELLKTYNVAAYTRAVATDSFRTFSFYVSAASSGTVRVAVPGDRFADLAGNFVPYDLSSSVEVFVTSPAPLSSSHAAASRYTNVSPVPWTLVFSEYISNVNAETLSSLVTTPNVSQVTLVSSSADSNRFTLGLHVNSPGTVNVDIPGGVFENAAGTKSNVQLQGSSLEFEDTPLTATSSPLQASTNLSPVEWRITFSRPVLALSAPALELSSCVLGAMSTQDNQTFNISLLPSSADATVSCSLLAGFARDRYGNYAPRTNATSTVAYSAGGPKIVSLRPVSGPLFARTSPVPWEIKFDKEVATQGMPEALFFSLLSGTNVSSFSNIYRPDSDYKTFIFDVHPDASNIPPTGRVVNVSVSADRFFDAFGNGVAAYAGHSLTYDTTPPVATISYSRKYSKDSTTAWAVSFNKPVTSFSTSFLSTAHNVAQYSEAVPSANNQYTFDVTVSSGGPYRVELLDLRVTDYAGNYAGNTLSAEAFYDHVAPQTVSNTYDLDEYPTGHTNDVSGGVPWKLAFSEDIEGFDPDDLSWSPGVTGVTSSGSGSSYDLILTIDPLLTHGDIYLNVMSGKFRDAAGNYNTSAVAGAVLSYESRPLLSSTLPDPDVPSHTNLPSINWVVSFSRPVVNFGSAYGSGLSLSNCSVLSFAASSDLRSFTLAIAPDPTTEDVLGLSVGVVAGHFVDAHGNANEASVGPEIHHYANPPACTYLGPVALVAYTNAVPIQFKMTFDRPVQGPVDLDACLSTTGVSSLSGPSTSDSKTFLFEVTPFTAGIPSTGITVAASLKSESVRDAGGNAAAPYTGNTVVYDGVAPLATISCLSDATTLNSRDSLWEIVFDSDVAAFSLSFLSKADNVLSFSTLQMVSQSRYRFTATADKAGPLSVSILPSTIPDRAGNYVAATSGPTILYDPENPVALGFGPEADITNAPTIPWTLTWSKKIVDFSVLELTTTNAAPITSSTATADSTTFSFDVVPLSPGTVTVAASQGAFHDEAGNGSAYATSSVEYDPVAPIATITPESYYTSSVATTWTLSFSEPVAVTSSAVSSLNTTSLSVSMVSETLYTAFTSAASPGAVTLMLLPDSVFDAAGNAVLPVSETAYFDTTAPYVTESGASASQVNAVPVSWRIVFSEPVLDFSADILKSQNVASRGPVTSTDNTTFDFEFYPSGYGPTGFGVDASSIRDRAGNFAAETQIVTVEYLPAVIPATIQQTGDQYSLGTASSTTWSVTFDYPVRGLSAGNLSTSYGVDSYSDIVSAGDNMSYTFVAHKTSPGPFRVAIEPGSVTNQIGSIAFAAESKDMVYDPSPLVFYDTPKPFALPKHYSSSFLAYVTASANVSEIESVVGTGCSVAPLSAVGSSWSFQVTPTGPSFYYTATLKAHVGGSLAVRGSTMAYDGVPPTADISSIDGPTNASEIPWTIMFSKAVSDFSMSVLDIENSVSVAYVHESAGLVSFSLYPDVQGPVVVSVLADTIHDKFGNACPPVTHHVAYDSVPPTAVLAPESSHSSEPDIRWHLTFSEPVADFTASALSFDNVGSYSVSMTSSTLYSIETTAASQGSVTLTILPGSIYDLAGNELATLTASAVFDAAVPYVVTNSSPQSQYNVSPVPWTISFSEPIFEFSTDQLVHVNVGSVGTVVPSYDLKSYSFSFVPGSYGLAGFGVKAHSIRDAAGNFASATAPVTVEYLPPVINATITQYNEDYTISTDGVTRWAIAFEHPVTGLELEDLETAYGVSSYSNVSGSVDMKHFTFDAHVSAPGPFKVALKGSAVQNAIGSVAGSTFGRDMLYDPTPVTFQNTSPQFALPGYFSGPFTAYATPSSSVSAIQGVTGSGCSVTGLSYGSGSYSFTVTPASATFFYSSTLVSSLGGAISFRGPSLMYDADAPQVASFETTGPSPTNVSPIPFSLVFSKGIVDFDIEKLGTSNVTSVTLLSASSDNTSYTFAAVPTTTGNATLTVPSDTFHDRAGNACPESTESVLYDAISPVATLTPLKDHTNSSNVVFALTFSEPVAGFTASALSFTNHASYSVSMLSETLYSLNVLAASQGSISVSVLPDAVFDLAGNPAETTSAYSVFDSVAPYVVSSGPVSPGTQFTSSPIPWKIVFSKSIRDFSTDDLEMTLVAQAGPATASLSDTVFTFDVYPQSYGSVGIRVVSGTIFDYAGNYVNSTAAVTVEYLPQVIGATITQDSQVSLTSSDTTSWAITFDYPVTRFDADDLSTSHGVDHYTNVSPSGDGRSFTFDAVVLPEANSPTIDNGGFETPAAAATFVMNPSANYVGNCGVAGNGSSHQQPDAPDGTQCAFLRNLGTSISYIDLGMTGLVAGHVYRAQFKTCGKGTTSANNLVVYVDSTPVYERDLVTETAWTQFQTSSFVATASTATLRFMTTNPYGYEDATLFLDSVTASDLTYSRGFKVALKPNSVATSFGSYANAVLGPEIIYDTQPVWLSRSVQGHAMFGRYSSSFTAYARLSSNMASVVSVSGTGCTASGLVSGASSWSFTVIPTSSSFSYSATCSTALGGTVTVSSPTLSYETTVPVITVSDPGSGYYNGPISSFLTSSEDIYDVEFDCTNCSIHGLVGASRTWTYDVVPTSDTTFSYSATVYDYHGNAAVQTSGPYQYSTSIPAISAFTGPGSYYENTTGQSTAYTITYDKPVTLVPANITASAGISISYGPAAANGTSYDTTWTFSLLSATNGTFGASVAAGVLDRFGNASTAASSTITTRWVRPISLNVSVTGQYSTSIALTVDVTDFSSSYSLWIGAVKDSNPNGNYTTLLGKTPHVAGTTATSTSATLTNAFTSTALTTQAAIASNSRYYVMVAVRDGLNRTAGTTSNVRTTFVLLNNNGSTAQTVVVDTAGVVEVSMWGATGGVQTANAVRNTYTGNGGFAWCKFNSNSGVTLSLCVPKRGINATTGTNGAGGGGAAGLRIGSTVYAIAGGSGGQGGRNKSSLGGGGGGGPTGVYQGNTGNPGTASAGGAGTGETNSTGSQYASSAGVQFSGTVGHRNGGNGGSFGAIWTGQTSSNFGWGIASGGLGGTGPGGSSGSGGGGGAGGGLFGGGGGRGYESSTSTANGFGGGGGSGYVNSALSNIIVASDFATFKTNKHYQDGWLYGQCPGGAAGTDTAKDGVVVVQLPF